MFLKRAYLFCLNILEIIDRTYSTWFAKHTLGSYGKSLLVNHKCAFTRNTTVGDYCNFNGMIVSGSGTLTIGSYFHSGTNCQIFTSNHNFEGEQIPYDSTHINKNIVIKDFVWLGSNVIIVGNVTIGEGAIIGAGAVVSRDIPDFAIAAGNPAKVLKYRNIEHFKKLKSERKYQ